MRAVQGPAPSRASQQPGLLPGTPQAPEGPQVFVQVPGGHVVRSGSPPAVYDGFRNQRNELKDQLDNLENQRENLASQLREPMVAGADKTGLEARIAVVDKRIVEVEKQLAEADASVARAAAVPGAVIPPRPPVRNGPPEEFYVLAGVFMFVVILPLTVAYARRIWRRGAAAVSAIPQEIYDRFNRVDQAVDAVAIEVERVGEGQRFLTRMYADQQRALGAGPAERIESVERERERQRKGS